MIEIVASKIKIFFTQLINSTLITLFLLIPSLSEAQSKQKSCSFDSIYVALQNDPNFRAEQIRLKKLPPPEKRNGDSLIVIPVVVHVIYKNAAENISDQQIASQIAVLNEDFRKLNSDTTNVESGFSKADSRIEFCLAQFDTNGQPTTGIQRYSTTIDDIGLTNKYFQIAPIWNRDEYLNIWVCDLGNNNAGFAYPPGSPANKDGVVIHYSNFGRVGQLQNPYDLGRSATHEVGHWLNLLHIWGQMMNCSNDDGVSDTPMQGVAYYGCPTPPKSSCGSKDMLSNFMGYVDDKCMGNFTEGQKFRMRTALLNSRPKILQSRKCGNVGLNSNQLNDKFTVFPNPTKGKLKVEFSEDFPRQTFSLSIYQIDGKQVYPHIQSNLNGKLIDLNSQTPGIYFLKITNGSDYLIKKIILQP